MNKSITTMYALLKNAFKRGTVSLWSIEITLAMSSVSTATVTSSKTL